MDFSPQFIPGRRQTVISARALHRRTNSLPINQIPGVFTRSASGSRSSFNGDAVADAPVVMSPNGGSTPSSARANSPGRTLEPAVPSSPMLLRRLSSSSRGYSSAGSTYTGSINVPALREPTVTKEEIDSRLSDIILEMSRPPAEGTPELKMVEALGNLTTAQVHTLLLQQVERAIGLEKRVALLAEELARGVTSYGSPEKKTYARTDPRSEDMRRWRTNKAALIVQLLRNRRTEFEPLLPLRNQPPTPKRGEHLPKPVDFSLNSKEHWIDLPEELRTKLLVTQEMMKADPEATMRKVQEYTRKWSMFKAFNPPSFLIPVVEVLIAWWSVPKPPKTYVSLLTEKVQALLMALAQREEFWSDCPQTSGKKPSVEELQSFVDNNFIVAADIKNSTFDTV